VADPLFHAALPEDWERARALGAYTTSTRDQSLDDVGFVHCSYRDQVESTVNSFYADLPEVVLLQIDRDELNVAVIDENLDGGSELFPHVYGALPLYAVVRADIWRREQDGTYQLAAIDAAS
jgi:glutathione S-transferase